MNLAEIKARAEVVRRDPNSLYTLNAVINKDISALIAEVELKDKKLAAIRRAAKKVIFTATNDTAKHHEAIHALAEAIKEDA